MSQKNNKKNYTAEDLLDEFFPNGSAEKDKKADSSPAETAGISEEISEEDAPAEDIEMVSDTLENDFSEAENADIIIGGDFEWESLELSADENDADAAIANAETVTEMTETVSEKAETAEASEEEDVNQKFIVRFIKGVIPWKGDSIWEIIRKIVFLAAVIVFVGAGIMLVSTLAQSKQAVQDKENIQSAVESIMQTTAATTVDSDGNIVTLPPKPLTKEEIAEQNFNLAEYFRGIAPDYVGFLEVEGCDIREPVVQTDDNKYYLTHTYYGSTNKAGALFMDYRCRFEKDNISPNIVIYGHNQEDGTMFGNLKEYKQNAKFYAENPVIKLSSDSETYEYLIYAFFVTNALEEDDSNGVVFHYHDYFETLETESTFDWYMEMIKERNQIVSPVDVRLGDKLLCLSTCSNEFSDSRFVVFARQLREGESVEDYDFSRTYLNPYAKGVDWDAIMSDETSDSTEETSETTTEFEIKIFVEDVSQTTVPGDDSAGTEEKHKPQRPAETEESSETEATSASDTETAPEETVTVVITDEWGQPVTDFYGETVTAATDESGHIITDDMGQPVTGTTLY